METQPDCKMPTPSQPVRRAARAAALVLVMVLLSSVLGHGQHTHQATEGHGHKHDLAQETANVMRLGDATLLLEPLIDSSGTMKLAVTATPHSGPFGVEVSTPNALVYAAEAEGATALVSLGSFQEGRFLVTANAGPHVTETAFTTQRRQGDLGSEIILVLVPEACPTTASEALVYAFEGGGDNIHRLFTMALERSDDVAPREEIALVHTHFREAFNTADFLPMANQAPLSFGAPGEWTINVLIHGGLPERASFAVVVPDH